MTDEAPPSEDAPAAPKAAAPADIRRILPFAGLIIALWATLPKYSGPKLAVKGGSTTEFVDHIIPGILVALMCLLVLFARKRPQGPGLVPFAAAAVTLLAGFWMAATHWQLLRQAIHHEAPWDGAIYHCSASLAVFGFGLLWTVAHWPDLSEAMAEDDRKRAAAG